MPSEANKRGANCSIEEGSWGSKFWGPLNSTGQRDGDIGLGMDGGEHGGPAFVERWRPVFGILIMGMASLKEGGLALQVEMSRPFFFFF